MITILEQAFENMAKSICFIVFSIKRCINTGIKAKYLYIPILI